MDSTRIRPLALAIETGGRQPVSPAPSIKRSYIVVALRPPIILLSKARPTSPEGDQTKKGGAGRVYRKHRGTVPRAKDWI